MKEGRYWSEIEQRYCRIYKPPTDTRIECLYCGKDRKNGWALVWEDDEDNLEYTYGTTCIKKLKLKKEEQR